jgi:hypothetical protein
MNFFYIKQFIEDLYYLYQVRNIVTETKLNHDRDRQKKLAGILQTTGVKKFVFTNKM